MSCLRRDLNPRYPAHCVDALPHVSGVPEALNHRSHECTNARTINYSWIWCTRANMCTSYFPRALSGNTESVGEVERKKMLITQEAELNACCMSAHFRYSLMCCEHVMNIRCQHGSLCKAATSLLQPPTQVLWYIMAYICTFIKQPPLHYTSVWPTGSHYREVPL